MAAVFTGPGGQWGASPQDWVQFAVVLGLVEDLLPVVSNPKARIAPTSKLQALGKVPSVYDRQGLVVGLAGWTAKTPDLGLVEAWSRIPDLGICVQTRRVRAIDIDVEDAAAAQAIRAAVEEHVGPMPVRVRGNSAKCLVAFEVPGELAKRVLRTSHGNVEFLATGQQFVAAGTHPSGARYVWAEGLPDAFPVLDVEAFERLWAMLGQRFGTADSIEARVSAKGEVLREAIAKDPMAQHLFTRGLVHGQERDGRLHIACPWAHEHTVDTGPQATTYWPAHTGGYERGGFRCLHAHCAHRTVTDLAEAIGYAEDVLGEFDVLAPPEQHPAPPTVQPPPAPHQDEEADKPKAKFTFESASIFASRPLPDWHIKGVLPRAEVVVLFGESGAGKSFVALDLAGALVRGLAWRGHRTRKARVAYVAAEGGGGFRKRLRAYAHQAGVPLSDLDDLIVVQAAPNLLERTDALEVAKAVLAVGGAGLVVIDTVAQVTPGGDENSAEDMGRMLAHCRGIHRATGATILLIHHAGKDLSKGARGWSGLKAAADAELEVSRQGDRRTVRVSKAKDAEDGLTMPFALDIVVIGEDEDGDEITSCVVRHLDGEGVERPARERPRGNVERLVWQHMAELADMDGRVEVEALISAVAGELPHDPQVRDQRRRSVRRAIEAMSMRNLLWVAGDHVVLTGTDGAK